MQLREDHDKVHLDHARAIFPDDPDILFLSACQRETYAGLPIQTAVRSAILPTGVTLDVGSERVELREAEALFRRVLELRPGYGEARMRYGRVLGGLGKHAEAASSCAGRPAISRQPVAVLRVVVSRRRREALGSRDAARVAYEQAARLSPMAQSPLLALSQLARRYGDRNGALRAIERCSRSLARIGTRDDDPWWWYYVAQARTRRICSRRCGSPIGRSGSSESRLTTMAIALVLMLEASGGRAQQSPAFSSKIEAVRVDVLVTDNGQPVRGLRPRRLRSHRQRRAAGGGSRELR